MCRGLSYSARIEFSIVISRGIVRYILQHDCPCHRIDGQSPTSVTNTRGTALRRISADRLTEISICTSVEFLAHFFGNVSISEVQPYWASRFMLGDMDLFVTDAL